MPANVVNLLLEKAELHSTQAFLMENIKAKDDLIRSIQKEVFDYNLEVPYPQREKLELFREEAHKDESWAWDQLKNSEYNEYLEAEAFAFLAIRNLMNLPISFKKTTGVLPEKHAAQPLKGEDSSSCGGVFYPA